MATVFNPLYNSPEDEQKDGKQVASSEVSLSSTAGPAGGGPTASSNPMAQRQGSGQAMNLQNYIKANVGGGDQIASGIQNKMQNQANQFGQEVQKAQGQLDQKAKPLEDELGEQGKTFAQSSFKDPQALLSQQDQLQKFNRLRTQGANADIEQLRNTQTQAVNQLGASSQFNNLQQAAQNAGRESGQFQLLQQTFGNPQYSAGQQRLDQLLLQAQPNVTRNLRQNLGQIQKSTQEQMQGLDSASQARLAALQGLSKTRADEISGMLSGGMESGLESDISLRGMNDIKASAEQRLAQAEQAGAALPGLRERLRNNTLTEADRATLGLQSGMQLYDTNLDQFINQNARQATLAEVADPTEFARYRALQQLAGDNTGDIFGGATEAGGFKPYEYDLDALNKYVDNRKNYYENTLLDEAKGVVARNPWTRSGYANQLRREMANVGNADQLQNALNTFVNNMMGLQGANHSSFDQAYNTLIEQAGLRGADDYLKNLRNQRSRVLGVAPNDIESGGNFTVG